MKSEDRDKRDDILDRALAAYSGQELPAGLEDRVLARVRAASGRWRLASPRWLFALAAAAGLLLWIAALRNRPVSRPNPQRSQTAVRLPARVQANPPHEAQRPIEAAAREDEARTAAVIHPKLQRSRLVLPKLEEFPARRPLSREERALLELVRQEPDEARKLAANQDGGGVQPIRIEAIHIEPLKIDGLPEE